MKPRSWWNRRIVDAELWEFAWFVGFGILIGVGLVQLLNFVHTMLVQFLNWIS